MLRNFRSEERIRYDEYLRNHRVDTGCATPDVKEFLRLRRAEN